MRPFASSYYVIHNKNRTFLLILLVAFSVICYLGALYITDPTYDLYRVRGVNRHVVLVKGTEGKDAHMQYESLKQNINTWEHVERAMPVSNDVLVQYESVMGFNNSYFTYGFLSEEDFQNFNQACQIMPEDFNLKDGEIIMSEMLAVNIGVKPGDVITREHEDIQGVVNPLTVAATYKGDAYQLFFVDSKMEESGVLLLRKADDLDGRMLKESVMSKAEEFENLTFQDYDSFISRLQDQMNAFTIIFYCIVILIAFVLAITINATFQIAFERRRFEFSTYKAIGFSRYEIMRKVLGEIFIIDTAGLVSGFILIFILLVILNSEVFIPSGKKIDYYRIEGIWAVLECNLIIVIPMILSQIKRVRKCTIMDY